MSAKACDPKVLAPIKGKVSQLVSFYVEDATASHSVYGYDWSSLIKFNAKKV